MNIWRLISFHEETLKKEIAQRFIDSGRIAIGWGNIGELSQYNSKDEIGKSIRHHYMNSKNSNIGWPSLWHMYANVMEGDLIVIDPHRPWTNVVEVTGDYKWNDAQPNVANFPDYCHQRTIKLRDDINADQLLKITGNKQAPGQTQHLVLFYYVSFVQELQQKDQ